LISTIPCILFHGDDIEFAVGTPSRKRFFIDQSVSLCNSDFIEALVKYSKALKSRNVILEQKKTSLLDSIDEIFASLALLITNERKSIVEEYANHFSLIYEEISGVSGVEIVYRPSIKVETEEDLLILLAEKRQNDLIDRTSSTGPHRDRIHFIKDKKPFTERASNGQRRLISLVLRMIQAKIYSEKTGRKPIFLMDDILLELDPEKRQKFMELLPPYEQLFCTFLPGEPYKNYQKETTKIFFVEEIVDGDARCDAANGWQMETIVGIQMCQKIAWQHEIRVVVVGHVLSTDKLVAHHRLKSSMCKSNDLVGQHIGREA